MKEIKIKTPCGIVIGETNETNEYAQFLGIEYGKAGRWEYPTEVTSWDGEYKAFHRGSSCWQKAALRDRTMTEPERVYHKEFYQNASVSFGEDCLRLNIWAPINAENAPVLFVIHGGGFSNGSKDEVEFDGSEYAKKGIIFVAINYRLNIFGFFTHPELEEKDGYTGNYGLFDQLTALEWVYHNIASFGGDPHKITAMGQSAGAMSVEQLVISPLTKNMLFGAIMHSGYMFFKKLKLSRTLEKSNVEWQAFMDYIEARSLDELKQMTAEEILYAWYEMNKNKKIAITVPIIDGRFIPEDMSLLLSKVKWDDIHILCGSLRDDNMSYVYLFMSKMFAKEISEKSSNVCYTFFMDKDIPQSKYGTFHSSDLWYALGSMQHCWRNFDESDYSLSELWTNYYVNFLKTGNPNGDNLPVWSPCSKRNPVFMRFGEQSGVMVKPSILKLLGRSMTHQILIG